MKRHACSLLLVLAMPLLAGESPEIEDATFAAESGWNRADSGMQHAAFSLGGASAYSFSHEMGRASARHQLSYTFSVYRQQRTGFGDATLDYRYQVFGDGRSRAAVAPRVSLILPTRSAQFGPRSSGLQVSVPVSVRLGARVTSHTNVGATWFRERDETETTVVQSLVVSPSSRVSLSVDAAYTRGGTGEHLIVVRPGLQWSVDVPGSLQITPGIAFPLAGGVRGALLSISFAHSTAARPAE